MHAIVPQKSLILAKGRLREALSDQARRGLAARLLAHVCATLRAVPAVTDVCVLTPDPVIRALAGAWGVPTAADPAPGLNRALAAVIAARRRRGGRLLVLAADLPWLRPEDVVAMLAAWRSGMLVLAPDADGTGTNGLLMPTGVPLTPAFGTGSLAAHRSRAAVAGLRVVEVRRPGLAQDLDTPGDLAPAVEAGYNQGYRGSR